MDLGYLRYDPDELPASPKKPYGFIVSETECSYNIEHSRPKMGCLNLFLISWLIIWWISWAFMFFIMPGEEEFDAIPSLLVLSILVSLLLIYSLYEKKSFYLSETSLLVKTRILFLKWEVTLPRETIAHVMQVQDGGHDRDSFPSWGLQIRSASDKKGFVSNAISLFHFGQDVRYRTVLYRLPYKHSYWLGITIARWANAPLHLCSAASRTDIFS